MKNLFKSLVVILLFSGFPVTGAYSKDLVAVMDFDNRAQYGGWRIGRGASDMLSTALVKEGSFRVIERDRLQSVLNEQNIGASGRVDSSTAANIGRILGVAYIITGSVTEYGNSKSGAGGGGFRMGKKGYHATVDIRMIDTSTAEIVYADSASGDKMSLNVKVFGFGGGESFNQKHASEAVRIAIDKLASGVAGVNLGSSKKTKAKAKGNALVADVDGKVITLNQGANGGFEVGQTVKLYKKGKVIKDPATGNVLKVKYKEVGAIRLIEVEATYAEGKVVSGSNFEVGNIVR